MLLDPFESVFQFCDPIWSIGRWQWMKNACSIHWEKGNAEPALHARVVFLLTRTRMVVSLAVKYDLHLRIRVDNGAVARNYGVNELTYF